MRFIIFFPLVTLLVNVIEGNEYLPDGKYMFLAPALYSNQGDEAFEMFSEVETIKENKQITFLYRNEGFAQFILEPSGEIKIGNSKISFGTIAYRFEGDGKMISDSTAKGHLKRSGITDSPNIYSINKSEWLLRPATPVEIRLNFERGLQEVADIMAIQNKEPTFENFYKLKNLGVGRGYSRNDLPEITEMVRDGRIEFLGKGKFIINLPEPPDTEPETTMISAQEEIEYIDIRELPQQTDVDQSSSGDVENIDEDKIESKPAEHSPTQEQEKKPKTRNRLPYITGAIILVAVLFLIFRITKSQR